MLSIDIVQRYSGGLRTGGCEIHRERRNILMAVGGQAELIYVKGPQAGQRASLMSAVVTVGRGQQADVQLTEEHVSRKHFQLTLTQDGWVFEIEMIL